MASLVVVGEDQADRVVRMSAGRRRGVFLVARDLDDPSVWRRAVSLGAEQVLSFPSDEPWLTSRFADAAEGGTTEALTVGVVGGRGGAGASVLAAGLSVVACRRGLSVVLVDLDPLGGGLDLVLGAEAATGLRWPDLAGSKGRLGARELRARLPDRHGPALLSWDRGGSSTIPPDAADAALAALRRASELVVLDLPRWPDRIAESAIGSCAAVLLVVPNEVRSVAAAARVAAGLTAMSPDVRVVSRDVSPSGLSGADVAAALGLPLSAHLAPEPRLAERLDRGESPGLDHKGPLAVACRRVLDDILDPRHDAS